MPFRWSLSTVIAVSPTENQHCYTATPESALTKRGQACITAFRPDTTEENHSNASIYGLAFDAVGHVLDRLALHRAGHELAANARQLESVTFTPTK
jgi:hypothetical protein